MAFKTWAVGEEVLAADFNSYVQRQTVAVFPNAAARTAAITAPTPGMVSYLSDVGRLEVYTDKSPAPGWFRPWYSSWGIVGGDTVVPDLPSFGAVMFIPGASVAVPTAGRLYQIRLGFNLRKANDVVGTITISFQQGPSVGLPAVISLSPNFSANVQLMGYYPGGGANIQAIAQCDSGTAGLTWGRMSVIDVGPA